jgi:hypothetical protein
MDARSTRWSLQKITYWRSFWCILHGWGRRAGELAATRGSRSIWLLGSHHHNHRVRPRYPARSSVA